MSNYAHYFLSLPPGPMHAVQLRQPELGPGKVPLGQPGVGVKLRKGAKKPRHEARELQPVREESGNRKGSAR